MRNLEFFETHEEYENHIWDSVFTEPWVRNCDFYRNLVNFIIDHRAPIFYTVSDAAEHFAFSGAYYFETRRQRYPNKDREQLFWLHDFTHMLFPYAHDLYETPESLFLKDFWYQERIASSETEIMSYYRVPGLREKVFQDEKLWYDVIRERGWKLPCPMGCVPGRAVDPESVGVPSPCRVCSGTAFIPRYGDEKPNPADFLRYRIRVQMEDEFGAQELDDHPEILAFIRKWRSLTPNWISKRYRSLAGMRIEQFPYVRNFTAENYEDKIMSYTPDKRPVSGKAAQENYERLITANVRMAYDLLQWSGKPQRWRHMPEAIDRLEGAVLLR